MSEPHKNGNGKRIGRPLKRGRPSVGERVMLGLRVTPEMKCRLADICAETGRSLSQEAEMRLERSFWLDDLLKARLISARVPAGVSATLNFAPECEAPNTMPVALVAAKRQLNIRATNKTHERIKKIADRTHLSVTDVLEWAVKELAAKEGIAERENG